VSVRDGEKKDVVPIVRQLMEMGFTIHATRGTRLSIAAAGLGGVVPVLKLKEGRPNVADLMRSREVALVINTPKGHGPRLDDTYIRALAITLNIPCITTMSAARAAVAGIRALRSRQWGVLPLQEYFPPKK